MNNVIIRKVEKKDFEGLVSLYEEVWPDVSYDKRAKTNFILNESTGISYCAELNKKIVGSRTSCYYNTYYGIKHLKCIHIGDSCVSKECRGKGIFNKMNLAMLKDFFDYSKGELIYNISVIASRKAYEKIGWQYIESLQNLRKIVRPFHVLKTIKWHIGMLTGVPDWESSEELPSISSELLSKREEYLLSQGRDLIHNKYTDVIFNWRMKSRSGIRKFEKSDLGAVLYKIGTKNGLVTINIGEVFLQEYSYENFKRIINSITNTLKPDILLCAISLGHPLHKFYKAMGFWANPKQKFLNHGVRVESEEMKAIAYNPQNWAISTIDIDTF